MASARTYPALDLTFGPAAGTGFGPPVHDGEARNAGSRATCGEGLAAVDFADQVSVALYELHPSAIHEADDEMPPRWRVFFGSAAARDAARDALAAEFGGSALAVAAVDVPDEDWAARTQSQLRAVRVGRVVVAPPWDVPPADASAPAGDLLVIIEPSTGFGTGHHESTRLCLELLQARRVNGLRVLDVGTGSGVLAIVASLLGAHDVLGIDEDPDAVAAARANAGLNRRTARVAGDAPGSRSQGTVSFTVADLRGFTADAPYDLVLANLTGGLLTSGADRLAACVRPGGTIIVAGFQGWEANGVLAAFAGSARVVERPFENGWEAALLRRE